METARSGLEFGGPDIYSREFMLDLRRQESRREIVEIVEFVFFVFFPKSLLNVAVLLLLFGKPWPHDKWRHKYHSLCSKLLESGCPTRTGENDASLTRADVSNIRL